MFVTQKQYDGMYELAHNKLRDNWRNKLVRNPLKRDWLVKTTCDAIKAELESPEYEAYAGDLGVIRPGLEAKVYHRVVTQNQFNMGDGTYGFAIMSIILAAVLSWLIKELLDWLIHG